MGADYFVYTEAKIGDKWVSIDPRVPKLVDKRSSWQEPHQYDGTVEYKPQLTYWNGSRSYFGESYNKLRQLGWEIKFADLSDEVKKEWSSSLEAEQEERDDRFYYPTPIYVDYNDFKKCVDYNRYDYHHLVHKDQWVLFETGEIEDIYGVEHEEFAELTPEEKQCYEYHEWDEPMGWNDHFKTLLRCVNQRITDFEDINNLNWGDSGIQYRLIVIQS